MKINRCRHCKYYFITWDRDRPYGCRAFGFKTKGVPWDVVKESSGKECMMFSPKDETRGPMTNDGEV